MPRVSLDLSLWIRINILMNLLSGMKTSYRFFSTLQKTPAKLINGGIEEYYKSKVKLGLLRSDPN
jgi:hypothetical protein